MEILNRLNQLLNNVSVTPEHKEICKSFKTYFMNHGFLTEKQENFLSSIENYNKEETEEYKNSWNEQKINLWKKIWNTFKTNKYMQTYVEKYPNAEIPKQRDWEYLMKNVYVKQLIENIEHPAKFQNGDHVFVDFKWLTGSQAKGICVVLDNEWNFTSLKNGREYEVLPISIIFPPAQNKFDEDFQKRIKDSLFMKKQRIVESKLKDFNKKMYKQKINDLILANNYNEKLKKKDN